MVLSGDGSLQLEVIGRVPSSLRTMEHSSRAMIPPLLSFLSHCSLTSLPDTPDENTRMVSVSQYHILKIPLMPCIPIQGIIEFCLSFFPHVKCFVHHDESHFITEIEQFRSGGIMRCTDAVDAHFLQKFQAGVVMPGDSLPHPKQPRSWWLQTPLIFNVSHLIKILLQYRTQTIEFLRMSDSCRKLFHRTRPT